MKLTLEKTNFTVEDAMRLANHVNTLEIKTEDELFMMFGLDMQNNINYHFYQGRNSIIRAMKLKLATDKGWMVIGDEKKGSE